MLSITTEICLHSGSKNIHNCIFNFVLFILILMLTFQIEIFMLRFDIVNLIFIQIWNYSIYLTYHGEFCFSSYTKKFLWSLEFDSFPPLVFASFLHPKWFNSIFLFCPEPNLTSNLNLIFIFRIILPKWFFIILQSQSNSKSILHLQSIIVHICQC